MRRAVLTLAALVASIGMIPFAAALPRDSSTMNDECRFLGEDATYMEDLCFDAMHESTLIWDQLHGCQHECTPNDDACYARCQLLVDDYNLQVLEVANACNAAVDAQTAFEACLANANIYP